MLGVPFPSDAGYLHRGRHRRYVFKLMRYCADAMLDKGDLEGAAVWRRILRAVEELQGMEPGPGAQVH